MGQRDTIALRVVDAFFRHRWFFLVTLVIVTGVTLFAISLRAHTYEASADTQVVTDNVAQELGQAQSMRNAWISPAQQNVNKFNDLVKDNLPGGFLDTALQNAHLSSPISVNPAQHDPRYGMLQKNLRSHPESNSLFEISLTWPNKTECERIVGSLQQQYIIEVGQDRAAQGTATTQFLDTQIQDYERRMRTAEAALIQYKQANSGHLPEQQTSDISQLASLQAQRDNLMITRQDSTLKMDAIQKRLAQISPKSVIKQNTQQSPLLSKLNELKAQRDLLMAKYTPTHPTILALNDQIATLQRQWARMVKNGAPEANPVTGVETQDNPEYISLNEQLTDARITAATQGSQLAELDRQINVYKARIAMAPTQQRELTDRTRDYSILKNRYETLLLKREEVKMQADLDRVSSSSALQRIGWIYATPTLSATKLSLFIIGSIVLGLIVGILGVVFGEWADRTLRYPADAERMLGVPVLAVIEETSNLKTLGAPSGRRLLTGGGDAPAPGTA